MDTIYPRSPKELAWIFTGIARLFENWSVRLLMGYLTKESQIQCLYTENQGFKAPLERIINDVM